MDHFSKTYLFRLEEMDREVSRQSEKQRAKVLQDLWLMDDQGVRPVKPSNKPANPPDEQANPNKPASPSKEPVKPPKKTDYPASPSNKPSTRPMKTPTKTVDKRSQPVDHSNLKIDTRKNREEDDESSWHEILQKKNKVCIFTHFKIQG